MPSQAAIYSYGLQWVELPLSLKQFRDNLRIETPCHSCYSPRLVRSAGQSPVGEGANIDWRLVPYTRDAIRTKSRIEFIYLFIYLFIYMHQPRCWCARIGILALVNSLKQKLISLRKQTWNGIYSFFFPKRNIIFLGTKERNLENKTSLYYYG